MQVGPRVIFRKPDILLGSGLPGVNFSDDEVSVLPGVSYLGPSVTNPVVDFENGEATYRLRGLVDVVVGIEQIANGFSRGLYGGIWLFMQSV